MLFLRFPALLVAGLAGARLFAQTNVFPSSGNVGVGTTSPAYLLHVNGQGRANSWIVANPSYAGQLSLGSSANYEPGLASDTNLVLTAGNGANLLYRVGAGEMMRITASGNVGIGTAAPAHRLQIAVDQNKAIASYAPSAASGIADFGAGGAGWQISRPEDGSYAHAVYSYNSANGTKNNLVVSTRSDLVFTVGQSGPTAAPERMRITEAGNIGIGTASPSAKLQVNGGDIRVTDTSPGAVAQLILDSDSGAGDIAFLKQGALKFMVRADVDASGGVLDVADRANGYASRVYVAGTGNVGIGTTNPTHKLAVNGTIRAKEVIVDTGWADHVFAADYRLAPLSEVEQHIQQNGHLPDVPSAADVAERGVSVGEMQKILLQKIEELTLHVIRLEKENGALQQRLQIVELKH